MPKFMTLKGRDFATISMLAAEAAKNRKTEVKNVQAVSKLPEIRVHTADVKNLLDKSGHEYTMDDNGKTITIKKPDETLVIHYE